MKTNGCKNGTVSEGRHIGSDKDKRTFGEEVVKVIGYLHCSINNNTFSSIISGPGPSLATRTQPCVGAGKSQPRPAIISFVEVGVRCKFPIWEDWFDCLLVNHC